MKNETLIKILIAAVLTGATLGAIFRFTLQLTGFADSQVAMAVDIAAAIIAGGVLICYIKYVRWIRKRDGRKA